MKTKLLMLPFLAALAFAGCTNDDDPGTKTDTQDGELRYLAVNIVTPKDPGVRAEFEPGSKEEDAAQTATFVLLNKDHKVAQVQTGINLAPWQGLGGNYDPNVENVSSAVIVVEKEEAQPEITGILAILNAPEDLSIETGTPLSDLKKLVGQYGTDGTENSFIMTNSVYVDTNDDIRIAAPVNDENFAKTPDDAKIKAVNIYVERVVAKIRTQSVNGVADFNQGTSVLIGTENKPLTIDIKGIQIANCTDKSYLFKNVDGFEFQGDQAPWSNWSDPDTERSYWAKMPVAPDAPAYANFSWNEISNPQGSPVLSLNEDHIFYAQENIVTDGTAPVQHTSVIVTAQLKDDAGNPFSFVKIAGIYYTADDGLVQIAKHLANRHFFIQKDAASYESIPAEYLQWGTSLLDGDKVWQGYAQLKATYTGDSYKYYQYDPDYAENEHYKPIESSAVDDALKTKDLRVLMWKEGRCYYFVDIEHFGTETQPDGLTVKRKGIIRNHFYDLALKSLRGLGVPVFDPEKTIIPEKPSEDEYFYLAASINILKWKMVSQNVEFN